MRSCLLPVYSVISYTEYLKQAQTHGHTIDARKVQQICRETPFDTIGKNIS